MVFGSNVIKGTTNAAGKVTLHIPGNAALGKRKAVAKKPGYARGVRFFKIIK